MGFDIYRIKSVDENRFALGRVGPLPLGGPGGLFAQHLPTLAADDENWSLDIPTLLQWAGFAEPESFAVFFDITPKAADQVNLLELVAVNGRTVSLLTDIVFHFKVAVASRNGAGIEKKDGEIEIPNWRESPDRFEHLRLTGGTRGGAWAWAEPPNSASATVL
jgi:hypothetical protein